MYKNHDQPGGHFQNGEGKEDFTARFFGNSLEIQTLPEKTRQVLLGLPQFRFKDKLPEVDWNVVIQVPYDEVSAPFRNINTWFFYIVFILGAVVVILALIFSWLLSKPVIETDFVPKS